MAHTIVYNEQLGAIVLRAKKWMGAAEIATALGEVVHVPSFKQGLSLIVDLRGCNIQMTGDELRALADSADIFDDRWGDTKCSILASNNTVYGLGRMFMALTDEHHVETRVFRTVHDADGWLGLGVDMIDILERTPD